MDSTGEPVDIRALGLAEYTDTPLFYLPLSTLILSLGLK